MRKKQNFLGINPNKVSEDEVKNYLIERLNEVKKSGKITNLVDFHSTNKFMIMAHDQEKLKTLGNIVASYKKISFSEILKKYEIHFRKSLENQPTIKKHSNVILHIFGFFSKNLNQFEKKIFLDIFEKYKMGIISLGEILSEIHPIIFKFDKTYLASQTYFLLYADTQEGILFEFLSNESVKKNTK